MIGAGEEQEADGGTVPPVETRKPVGSLALALVGLPVARRKPGSKDEVVSDAVAPAVEVVLRRNHQDRVCAGRSRLSPLR